MMEYGNDKSEGEKNNGITEAPNGLKQRNGVERAAAEESASTSSPQKKPSYSHLKSLVKKFVRTKTWWELYGIDFVVSACTSLIVVPFGFLLLSSSNVVLFSIGILTLAYLHNFYGSKCAHMAAHCTFGKSKFINRCIGKFSSEVCFGFTFEGAQDIHIKTHHPYTNIIGLGDSSSWRAPYLDRLSYLFIAPLFLPVLSPFYSVKILWGRWKSIMTFLTNAAIGVVIHFILLRKVSGFSVLGALLCMFATRGLFTTVYVHLNIFQHIGLTFYTLERRPDRVLQMATGVLNMQNNIFLSSCFGNSITNCHVEHHLFPKLSDNMCLAIKPLVLEYFKVHNLPYNEDSYTNRLKMFFNRYTELMVHAPPITDFIGIQ